MLLPILTAKGGPPPCPQETFPQRPKSWQMLPTFLSSILLWHLVLLYQVAELGGSA